MHESLWIIMPVVAFAALVRGYAGFGFAAIAVVGMNLFLTPQQSIPIILGLDLLCSISLWKQARQQAEIATFKILTLGSLVGIPIGFSLLILVPPELLKFLICLVILIFALILIFDFRLQNADSLWTKLTFGLASGIGTAGASVGGPMIVSYMLSSSLAPATQRATMILFFIISETLALIALFTGGLIDWRITTLLLTLLVPTLIMVKVGQSMFNRYPPKSLKHFALPIMTMVAIFGISASIQKMN
ncbi:TSUP family transporter [Vibrio sp. WJH972]